MNESNTLKNLDMERAALGALLIEPTYVSMAVNMRLAPEHFTLRSNQIVCRAILVKGEAADLLTVAALINTAVDLLKEVHDEVGHIESYLAQLVTEVPTALNFPSYAEAVIELARRRAVLDYMGKAAKDLYGGKDSEVVSAELGKLMSGFGPPPETPDKDALLAAYAEEREQERVGTRPTGILTGLKELDLLVNGFRPGNMITVAGPPGMGKSTLMMNFILQAAKSDVRSALVSVEMNEAEMIRKMVAAIAGVNTGHQYVKKLTDDDWKKEHDAMNTLSRLPVDVFYKPGARVEDVARVLAAGLSSPKPYGLTVVDYLQIMETPARASANRTDAIGQLTRSLKALAGQMSTAIVVGSQISRKEGYDREPQMSDLRESGSIEADSDVILMIHDPKALGAPNLRTLYVRKNRHGPTGEVPMIARMDISRFGGAVVTKAPLSE